MITGKIDVTKILKEELYQGKTAKYLDLVMFLNTDETGTEVPDQYGNDGVIKQSLSKESRDAGKKSPILGNYKVKTTRSFADKIKPAPAFQNRPKPVVQVEEDDQDSIPF
jgi:hypothetical protein